MNTFKTYLPLGIRILLAFMFFLSAAAKLYPDPYYAITKNFELKQLIPLGFNEYFAMLFSRFIIGAEIALGIGLLQKKFLKSIIIPLATLMLVIFSFHLSYEIVQTGGSDGNCGCFGELIPMTPIESLLKNILAIGLLVFLYVKTEKDPESKNYWFLGAVYAISTLLIFAITLQSSNNSGTLVMKGDAESYYAEFGPENATSRFSKELPYIDEGLQILCFFNPDCDHCKEAGKGLVEVTSNSSLKTNISILFEENEDLVPAFFTFIGKEFTYKTLDIPSFLELFTWDNEVPGIFILWNGNIVKTFQGSEGEQAFTKEKFELELAKIQAQIEKGN